MDAFLQLHLRGINKDDFPGVWGAVFLASFTEETNKKAFEATGIWPFNRDIVNPKLMEPSKVWSSKTAFALPLPSPARRIVAMMHTPPNKPNACGFRLQHTGPQQNTLSSLTEVLEGSPSGAFLVSSDNITSAQEISPPIIVTVPPTISTQRSTIYAKQHIEKLRVLSEEELFANIEELIENIQHTEQKLIQAQYSIEAANAQLVVQHLHALKLKASLTEKEKRKPGQHTRVFADGLGKVFTSDDIYAKVQEQWEARKEKEKESVKRAKEKEEKRRAKQALDRWWEVVGQQHTAALAKWQDETEKLKNLNIPRKKWPEKPTKPRKKCWKEFMPSVDAIESVADEEEDEDDNDDDFHWYQE